MLLESNYDNNFAAMTFKMNQVKRNDRVSFQIAAQEQCPVVDSNGNVASLLLGTVVQPELTSIASISDADEALSGRRLSTIE